MSRRTLWLAVLAIALGAGLLVSKYGRFFGGPLVESPFVQAESERVLAPSAADRLARIDARLRLPPDRRAIAALGEIRRLLHGGAATPAEVAYAHRSWKVTHEGRQVGLVSEQPRFSALLSLLDEFAARELARPGAVELAREPAIPPELQKRLSRFDDVSAFAVLSRVDAAWAKRSASVGDLLAATDALAQLCALLPRDLPGADGLASRAFASLALARQVAPERTLRAEVHLAFATGYVAHARARAEQLPAGEPLAAFVRSDLDSLETAAGVRHSHEARFLYGTRLVSTGASQEWIAWYRDLPKKRAKRAAMVRTALEDSAVSTGSFVPESYAAALLARFGVPAVQDESPARALGRCDALRERLDARARKRTGPFADAALYRDAYQAACLSAVYRKLVFFMDATHHPEFALELARSLPAGSGKELAAWTELVAADAVRDPHAFVRAIGDSTLGELQRQALARRVFASLAPDDARRSDVADAVAARLDSRPLGRLFAAELARDVYRDPALEERLFAAAVDVDGLERPTLASQAASLRRNWSALWAMAEADTYRTEERIAALRALEKQQPLEAARLRRAYERVLVANPESEPVRWQFARFLEKSLGERKRARFVLAPIAGEHDTTDSAAADAAAEAIARLHLEGGEAHAAWSLLEPRLARLTAQSLAVRAQIALGNLARAEEIARAARERNPRSLASAAELTAVLWEAQRHDEAAQLVAKLPRTAPDGERCWHVCRAFVRTFAGPPSAEGEAAFRALVAAHVDESLVLGTLAALREHGNAEAAVALGKVLDTPDASLEARTAAYLGLKQHRGEAAARTWLLPKLSPEQRVTAAEVFYARGADELLWRFLDSPEIALGSDTWVLRALAFAREREPDPAHHAALTTWFAAHQATPDEQLGAALVGLIPPDALLARIRSEADLSRAAYHLGARAETARDLHGAMRLYQLALASPRRSPGRDLAHAAVTRIEQLDTSLDALAADSPPGPVLAAGR